MTYTQAPKWTPAEIKILCENYPNMFRRQLMELLPNRSEFAIGSKAKDLQLKSLVRSKLPKPKNVWSDWDAYHLRSIYSTATKQQLIETFPNRTWAAIEEKSRLLGLRKTPEFLSQIRAECAKKTAASRKKIKRDEDDEDGEKVVVVKPAEKDCELAQKAIAQRTPLEQAWGGNV